MRRVIDWLIDSVVEDTISILLWFFNATSGGAALSTFDRALQFELQKR